MASAADRNFLKSYYRKSNPFSQLPMIDNYGLLMFYCSAMLKDNVFYIPAYDAVVIAEQNDNVLCCHDIYCNREHPLPEILSSIASANTNTAVLGFTPFNTGNCRVNPLKSENTLFIYAGKENIFAGNKLIFPALSHA